MSQFGGSLRFVQLPAVAQLLAGLGGTGRMYLQQGDWKGDLVLRGGAIIGANLGSERGRAALESIAIGLGCAEFSFVDEPVSADSDPLVDEAEWLPYLKVLKDERERLAKLIPSLSCVPKLVDRPFDVLGEGPVTIGRAALNIIPLLASGETLDRIARQRGLARTLRDMATLVQGGLVRLEEVSSEPALVAVAAADAHYEPPPPVLEQAHPVSVLEHEVAQAVSQPEHDLVQPVSEPQPVHETKHEPQTELEHKPEQDAQPLVPTRVQRRLNVTADWSMAESPSASSPFANLRSAVVRFFLEDEPTRPADRLRRFQSHADAQAMSRR